MNSGVFPWMDNWVKPYPGNDEKTNSPKSLIGKSLILISRSVV
jgi:hypothetical protein